MVEFKTHNQEEINTDKQQNKEVAKMSTFNKTEIWYLLHWKELYLK